MGPHVLVVDDEPSIQLMVRSMLDRTGRFRVSTVGNGDDALRMCHDDPVDVVLLDVMMPGIDGFSVCEQLKGNKRTAGVRVIMFSALAQRSDYATGRKVGADDYLSKPFTPKQLVDAIDHVLGQAAA